MGNSNVGAYCLEPFGVVSTHGIAARPWLLHDGDYDRADLEIEASVASGDCLISLATTLDQVGDLLNDESEIARPQLEKIVSTLLYLQRRYKLVRKAPEHRQ
ncbi:MAG TPA: hypothetical protein VHB72_02615 [Candidatus Saccharimonadales bacterium]|nr:hypothetical protein [Candidatus Saccharimonadales bacterium]